MAQRKTKKTQKKILLDQVIEKLKNTMSDFSKKPDVKRYKKNLRKAGKILTRTLKLEIEEPKKKNDSNRTNKKKSKEMQSAS